MSPAELKKCNPQYISKENQDIIKTSKFSFEMDCGMHFHFQLYVEKNTYYINIDISKKKNCPYKNISKTFPVCKLREMIRISFFNNKFTAIVRKPNVTQGPNISKKNKSCYHCLPLKKLVSKFKLIFLKIRASE
jgi:hypothetical protein